MTSFIAEWMDLQFPPFHLEEKLEQPMFHDKRPIQADGIQSVDQMVSPDHATAPMLNQ